MSQWRLGCDGWRAMDQHRALRSRWRMASLAAGWPFPSDWESNAVDHVCDAVVNGDDLDPRLTELGSQRAEAGVGLSATLHDLAALHAAMTNLGEPTVLISADVDSVPAHLVRMTSLGWAEVVGDLAAGCEVEDALTGLTTAAYLRTRLHELYRHARSEGADPANGHALLTVTLPMGEQGWPRMMGMVLAADVLRTVFDSGETLSLLRASTAAVLAEQSRHLSARCERARWLIDQRIASDPDLRDGGAVRVNELRLPSDHSGACALLRALG